MIIALLGESATESRTHSSKRRFHNEVDSFLENCYTAYYKRRPAVTKPEASDPIALRIPLDILAKIDNSGAATERTRSRNIPRALRYYLSGEGSEILAAIEGRRQIAEGKSHEMDEVIAGLDANADGKAA